LHNNTFLLFFLLRINFVRPFSQRCLDQTWWNLVKVVGISYAMWSCAFNLNKGWFLKNCCRCHGNGQNAKKLKKTKMFIAGYSPNINWCLMKGIKKFFKSPLFCFHVNCGKVCPIDSNFFGLFRSTRCGCCSYQVSSIYIRRVTCYEHFCLFKFFSILAVSMATAAIF
jgi:hypothetical protein